VFPISEIVTMLNLELKITTCSCGYILICNSES
jgi:hypothetical protein